MLETPEELISGMRVVLSLFDNAKGIFGVEDNKPDAIAKLQELTKDEPRMEVMALKTKYPQGAERQLIFATTGRAINSTIYENPSPGNKKGGITTLEDKSLGCTQKSGSAAVKGVLSYGQVVETPGLNLLSAPGNDLVASTALAASGAHIVLFTTGRGTPFASPVPTVKISSNSPLANKKQNWIDFNSGVLVEDAEMEETAQKFFDYIIEVASGKKVCSEEAGFHDMAIFKQGVTL